MTHSASSEPVLVRVVDDEHPLPLAQRGITEVAAHAVPTQVANPKRTTWRSVLQLLLALALALPWIIPIILEYWSPTWLVAALAQVLAVQTVLVRVMALPGVNQWLVDHFPALAAIPTRLERL